mmetsp:Transcript_17375/g.60673  ORF Transcript_17375/g.60673 Transcript_17375/m.60673 type:complete len:221 (+) Transcript_17375:695-1357(+)
MSIWLGWMVILPSKPESAALSDSFLQPVRSFRSVYTVSIACTLAPFAASSVRLRHSWKISNQLPSSSFRRFTPNSAPRSSAPQVIASTRGAAAISCARKGAWGTSVAMGIKVTDPSGRPTLFSSRLRTAPILSMSSLLETLGTTYISGLFALNVATRSASQRSVSRALIRTQHVFVPKSTVSIHRLTSSLAASLSAAATESSRSTMRASAFDARALSKNF